MFDENTVELNISMRDPATGMNYENVPKVIVEISK